MKIILDMDVGIDDAMALAYALASSECELLGIVGVYGNVSMETSVRNSLRLLEYFERTDIPVYKGSEQSLLATNPFEPNKVITDIHGIDGVGNTHLTTPKATAQQEDGIDYLIDMSHRYGKELCIVPTGPLTNIAKMLQRCPEVAKAIAGNCGGFEPQLSKDTAISCYGHYRGGSTWTNNFVFNTLEQRPFHSVSCCECRSGCFCRRF